MIEVQNNKSRHRREYFGASQAGIFRGAQEHVWPGREGDEILTSPRLRGEVEAEGFG
jgi:hypothetical protein